MPTNANAYNSRVTDESLEKRFRDTFRAQGGAELVDDLYASGVIVPIVDFTAAATGTAVGQNLQTAWDTTTGHTTTNSSTDTLISNAGFWQVDLNLSVLAASGSALSAEIYINTGLSTTTIWEFNLPAGPTGDPPVIMDSNAFVVFLNSGNSLVATTNTANITLDVWYRQIATLSGDLVNPSGFTSS